MDRAKATAIVTVLLGVGVGIVQIAGGVHLWRSGHPWIGGTIAVLGGGALLGAGTTTAILLTGRVPDEAAQPDGTTSVELH